MQYQSLFRRHTEILFFIILLTTWALIFQFAWNIRAYFWRHFEIFFLISPRKQALTFHANCLLLKMTICMKYQRLLWRHFEIYFPEFFHHANCHEMSKPSFLKKNQKSSAEYLPSMLSIKTIYKLFTEIVFLSNETVIFKSHTQTLIFSLLNLNASRPNLKVYIFCLFLKTGPDIAWNWHLRRLTFTCNVKPCFQGKIRKILLICHMLILPSAL